MYISKIEKVIRESDEILNPVIQKLLDRIQSDQTPEEWRIANYEGLRRLAYPKTGEATDAQAKLFNLDPVIQAEGQAQLEAYSVACFAVKLKFPKVIQVAK